MLVGHFDPDPTNKDEITNDEALGMMIGVYPPIFHPFAQYGIYVMTFMKNYKWRYVVIDDKLPCRENGDILFGHNATASETWVGLIEKAYAKLHNCYMSLKSGDIAQGLSDLTGKVAEKYVMDKSKIDDPDECDKIWKKLLGAKEDGTQVGCSAEGETEGEIEFNGEPTGLMSGHAYAIIDCFELKMLPDEKKKGKSSS